MTPQRARGYQSSSAGKTAVGVDVGATLAKLARRDGAGKLHWQLLPAEALAAVAAEVRGAAADRVGLTGGGAEALSRMLDEEAARVNEFAAWGAGARSMLEDAGEAVGQRQLVVSVGTGTSVLLADGLSVNRIGGTALGGGTVVGLATSLIGTASFAEIAALAEKGDRRRVDLLVSDIYRVGEIPLTGDLTAANFGRLARDGAGHAASREDVAHAVMGLVGENVALVCGGLAAAAQVTRVVFGGCTLRRNPALVAVLDQITRAMGRTPIFLPEGEFAGALGALLLVN